MRIVKHFDNFDLYHFFDGIKTPTLIHYSKVENASYYVKSYINPPRNSLGVYKHNFVYNNDGFYDLSVVHQELFFKFDMDEIFIPYVTLDKRNIISKCNEEGKDGYMITTSHALFLTFDGPDELGLIWRLSI